MHDSLMFNEVPEIPSNSAPKQRSTNTCNTMQMQCNAKKKTVQSLS